MSRERQRANRRLKDYMNTHGGQLPDGETFIRGRNQQSPVRATNTEKPWLNHEGYHDPTAYAAIYKNGRI